MAVRTWVNGAAPFLDAPTLQAMETDIGLGAQLCATTAEVTAIPSASRYIGKLAYAADTGITWKYVGAGNAPIQQLSGSNMTPGWIAWHKAADTFTPVWTNLGFTAPANNWGLYGISGGMLWVDAVVVSNTTPTLSTSDLVLTLPLQAVAQFGDGGGTYAGLGGNSGANNQHDLYAYPVGPFGTSSTLLRIRVRVASATGASVKQNSGLGNYITAPSAGDWMGVHFRGACANLA